MFSNKTRKTLKGKTYLASVIPLLMAAQAQGIEFYGHRILRWWCRGRTKQ